MKLSENVWKCLEMSGNSRKWLEWLEMACHDWKWLEIVENGQKWLKMAETMCNWL